MIPIEITIYYSSHNPWWLLVPLVIVAVGVWFFPKLRIKIFDRYIKAEVKRVEEKNKRKEWIITKCFDKIIKFFNDKIAYFVILGYCAIFIGLLIFIYYIFGEKQFVSGIVLGATVVTFIIFELPRLLKPNFYVAFLPNNEKNDGYIETPKQNIEITPKQGKALFFFRITNLGLNNCKDCTLWFKFPKGFMPLKEPCLYKELDFSKQFELQKQNYCAKFTPDKNYLTVAPGNSSVFPIWVKTPGSITKNEYDVEVSATSDTRWGEFDKKLKFGVTT
jgi:hypothetical protein